MGELAAVRCHQFWGRSNSFVVGRRYSAARVLLALTRDYYCHLLGCGSGNDGNANRHNIGGVEKGRERKNSYEIER